jgi:hypothetical protein
MPHVPWGHDPVLPLLALAFSDGVFEDGNITPDALYSLSEPNLPRGNDVPLIIKKEALESTVLRQIVYKDGQWIRGSAGMNYDAASRGFKKACFNAGFSGGCSMVIRTWGGMLISCFANRVSQLLQHLSPGCCLAPHLRDT